ncbi:hypothetical protein GLW08_18700 [Pontibacillus yanchengensis]|uniref:Uncharacterized protein n=2 Tax=Pontibacillus yanchengensis TaxID=462910 RepID=A0ACC7VM64_9BACI|nr:hypothetical protein [Pontibacillus yanchengensis]MYL33757.1 hypothetical protein [Pontibacillus yanchengensis]MYL55345.1 hypothetical protein [Pontibacillus yanchengensis]
MKYIKGLLSILVGAVIILSGCGAQEEQSSSGTSGETSTNGEKSENKNEASTKTLSEDKAEQLMKDLEVRLQPRTNEDGKVVEYKTKDEMVNYLSEVTDQQLAKKLVDNMYEKKDDGLYIQPDEFGPFLSPDKDYKFEKIEEGKYKLVQKNKTDAEGTFTLTVFFKLMNDTYNISDYKVKSESN